MTMRTLSELLSRRWLLNRKGVGLERSLRKFMLAVYPAYLGAYGT
jgi:hypothetical protein